MLLNRRSINLPIANSNFSTCEGHDEPPPGKVVCEAEILKPCLGGGTLFFFYSNSRVIPAHVTRATIPDATLPGSHTSIVMPHGTGFENGGGHTASPNLLHRFSDVPVGAGDTGSFYGIHPDHLWI